MAVHGQCVLELFLVMVEWWCGLLVTGGYLFTIRCTMQIWLRFDLFIEMLAETFCFWTAQQRKVRGRARIGVFERAASDCALNGGKGLRPAELSHVVEPKQAAHPRVLSAASTLSFSTTVVTFLGNERDLGVDNLYAVHDNVDRMKLAGIRLAFASKS